MASNEFDVKLVLLGNSGVGKTSLVLRYVQGTYTLEQSSTIGASFMTKRMQVEDQKLKLQIWDTAGQERFRSMTPMYYRGSNCAILVYDITSEESFENVKDWVSELSSNIRTDIVIVVCGNKCDLESQRVVSSSKAKEYASSINAIFIETSAKDNERIDELFTEICTRLIEKRKQGATMSPKTTNNAVDVSPKSRKRERCCN